MYKYRKNLVFFMICLIMPVLLKAAEPISDVRTVIDISGSMKKNDPENLRSPALKLLVELLPEGSQSGVWTFGQYVNMNVKQGTVDAGWKNKARQEASKIHSRGLYTNIEQAIRKATYNWDNREPQSKRSLILLTDGVVDISKDKQINQQSRSRIIEELIPRIKKAGAKIHTVALSKEADHQLLKQMSTLTGGWYEQVENAAQLQKVFLRLFEKSSTVDSLPIKANKFNVDENVKDMTLVLFHEKKSQPAKVITPGKKVISEKNVPEGVRWHSESGYDLITVRKPEAGEWQLETEVDPANRVMVVTNLRLKVSGIPNNLLLGDELIINAHLTEDGKKIIRQDFLKLVDFSMDSSSRNKENISKNMHDDGVIPDEIKQDGMFSESLSELLVAGKNQVSVRVKGPTFTREYTHLLRVYDVPMEMDVAETKNGDIKLLIRPFGEILQLPSVSAQIVLPDGTQQTFSQEESNQWVVIVPALYRNQTAEITLIAKRMDDKSLKHVFRHVLTPTNGGQPVSLEKKVYPEPVEKTLAPVVPGNASPPESDEKEINEQPEEHAQAEQEHKQGDVKSNFNWTFVLSMTLLINLLAIIGGFVVYKMWRKRVSKDETEQESELIL